MKLLTASLILLLGLQSHALDCTKTGVKTENVAEFLKTIADSLTNIKIQFKKIKALQSKKDTDITDTIVAIKELKSSYLCSQEMVSAFKKSKNMYVSESSDAMATSYSALAIDADDTIGDIKAALDGKAKLSPGENAEKNADKMIDIKKKWELIIVAISVGANAAVDKENPKTKKMDTLIITKKERDDVVNTLKDVFTLPAKKEDQDPIDAAASIYYGFLTQKWNFK